MLISVIIVNYNLTLNVVESVKSIVSNVSYNNFEIIIVDNNSTQIERDLLNKELSSYDNVKIYFLESNKGFGAGNNFGFSKTKGDILFLLNPDTLFTKDIFSDVNKVFDDYSDISVLGPKIINENNIQEKSAGKYPNLLSEFLNMFLVSRYVEKKYFNAKVKKAHNACIDVDWITGSAMFIRRSAFKKVSGFDTDFFMYSEEIDLCKRIHESGERIVYYPAAELVHKGSVGSKKNYFFFTKTSYESKHYYIKKHFKGIEKFLMFSFLKIHISIQIFIWAILYPLDPRKSAGKLRAFSKLVFASRISESENL